MADLFFVGLSLVYVHEKVYVAPLSIVSTLFSVMFGMKLNPFLHSQEIVSR